MNSRNFKYVHVVNKMDHEYSESFKGDLITLKPNEKKKMDRFDAAMFLGQFAGDKVEKNLEIEPIFEEQKEEFISQLDGKKFDNKDEYEKHIDSLRKRLNIGNK